MDNDGKNPWDYWTTYIQDKNGTIWKANLNIANTANGEKILYDVDPIKKVGQSVKSDTSLLPTGRSVRESDTSTVNPIIRNHEENINRKFSISAEKNFPELYRAQLRTLERLNLAASKEYNGYVEQLNRYKLQLRAKEVLEEYYAAVHENEEAINELKNAYRDWVREQNLDWEAQEDD